MDARRILLPRSSGSQAECTPCPCNKPGLTASVASPHHRRHQPTSTLPSPQGLGHSIYQPTPGPSRRHSFTTVFTSRGGANAGTEEGFLSLIPPLLCSYTYRTCRELIPPAIKPSRSTTVTPPKAPSSSGVLVTCGTSFHLARPTTDQTQRIRYDAETVVLQSHAMYQEHPGRCRECQAATKSSDGALLDNSIHTAGHRHHA